MTSTHRAPVLPAMAVLLGLLSSGGAAMAQATSTVPARVVSSTPVYAQVQVPRQVCWDEVQQLPANGSGAGALMGAIAGGAMGNAIGSGSGQALATGLGIFGGAILGNRIETQGQPARTQRVQRCEQQTSLQNQIVAYDVVYELNGQRYSTQQNEAPGSTLDVDVTVRPSGYVSTDSGHTVVSSPVYAEPVPVTVIGSPTWVIQAGSTYYPSHTPRWHGVYRDRRDHDHRPHAGQRPPRSQNGVIRVPHGDAGKRPEPRHGRGDSGHHGHR